MNVITVDFNSPDTPERFTKSLKEKQILLLYTIIQDIKLF